MGSSKASPYTDAEDEKTIFLIFFFLHALITLNVPRTFVLNADSGYS